MYENLIIYGGLAIVWVTAWTIGERIRSTAEDSYRARLPAGEVRVKP